MRATVPLGALSTPPPPAVKAGPGGLQGPVRQCGVETNHALLAERRCGSDVELAWRGEQGGVVDFDRPLGQFGQDAAMGIGQVLAVVNPCRVERVKKVIPLLPPLFTGISGFMWTPVAKGTGVLNALPPV